MRYRVSFLQQKSSRQGVLLIRIRVSWPGGVVQTHTGWSCPDDLWDRKKQSPVIGRTTPANIRRLAADLVRVKSAIETEFSRMELDSRIPTKVEVERIVRTLLGLKAATESTLVAPAIDRMIEQVGPRDSWSPSTIKKFKTLRNNISAWQPNLELDDITAANLPGFVKFMADRGYRNTYANKTLGVLRWFCGWAEKEGLLTCTDYKTFRPRLKGVSEATKKILYLTRDELMALYTLDLSKHPSYECVRDVFCFCCFSGLRYSDVSKLQLTDVHDGVIDVVTMKTTDSIFIELNAYTRAIIDKYREYSFAPSRRSNRKNTLLPVISNQKMNKTIKIVAKMAGIDTPIRTVHYVGSERIEEVHPKYELIGTHCGRHTFVVLGLTLGIPITTIMKWTGHSDYESISPYLEITDQLKRESMTKFDIIDSNIEKNE